MRNTVSLAAAVAIAIAVPSLAPRISNVSGVQGDGGGGGQAPPPPRPPPLLSRLMAGEEEKAAQLDGGAASECGEVGKIDRLLSHPHSLSLGRSGRSRTGPDRRGE